MASCTCSRCGRRFDVPDDEYGDHECPTCGFGPDADDFGLRRVDKGDGSREDVDPREAIPRIARHLDWSDEDVYEHIRDTGRIETDFAVYERHGR